MDNKIIATLIVLAMITSGAITYAVVETGKELTCPTNKPTGWIITATHDNYYEATCPYKTKPVVNAYCSEFRSTATYQRYGCKEVTLEEIPKDDTPSAPAIGDMVCNQYMCWMK